MPHKNSASLHKTQTCWIMSQPQHPHVRERLDPKIQQTYLRMKPQISPNIDAKGFLWYYKQLQNVLKDDPTDAEIIQFIQWFASIDAKAKQEERKTFIVDNILSKRRKSKDSKSKDSNATSIHKVYKRLLREKRIQPNITEDLFKGYYEELINTLDRNPTDDEITDIVQIMETESPSSKHASTSKSKRTKSSQTNKTSAAAPVSKKTKTSAAAAIPPSAPRVKVHQLIYTQDSSKKTKKDDKKVLFPTLGQNGQRRSQQQAETQSLQQQAGKKQVASVEVPPYDKTLLRIGDERQYLKKLAPNLETLIKNIKRIDKEDATRGQLKKHVIYTEQAKSYHGSQLIASALMANGYHLVKIDKESKTNNTQEYRNGKNENVKNTFAFLDKNTKLKVDIKRISIDSKGKRSEKQKDYVEALIDVFNARSDNVPPYKKTNHDGKVIRIMVIDGDYKEGIDLFDVSYFHAFGGFASESNRIQAVGRVLRDCGQCRLNFSKEDPKGWTVRVFQYVNVFPKTNFAKSHGFDRLKFSLQAMNRGTAAYVNHIPLFTKWALESALDNKYTQNINFASQGDERRKSFENLRQKEIKMHNDAMDAKDKEKALAHLLDKARAIVTNKTNLTRVTLHNEVIENSYNASLHVLPKAANVANLAKMTLAAFFENAEALVKTIDKWLKKTDDTTQFLAKVSTYINQLIATNSVGKHLLKFYTYDTEPEPNLVKTKYVDVAKQLENVDEYQADLSTMFPDEYKYEASNAYREKFIRAMKTLAALQKQQGQTKRQRISAEQNNVAKLYDDALEDYRNMFFFLTAKIRKLLELVLSAKDEESYISTAVEFLGDTSKEQSNALKATQKKYDWAYDVTVQELANSFVDFLKHQGMWYDSKQSANPDWSANPSNEHLQYYLDMFMTLSALQLFVAPAGSSEVVQGLLIVQSTESQQNAAPSIPQAPHKQKSKSEMITKVEDRDRLEVLKKMLNELNTPGIKSVGVNNDLEKAINSIRNYTKQMIMLYAKLLSAKNAKEDITLAKKNVDEDYPQYYHKAICIYNRLRKQYIDQRLEAITIKNETRHLKDLKDFGLNEHEANEVRVLCT